MSGKRWAKSRDANEPEIVHALRARGVPVYRIESTLDPGVYDLLCDCICPHQRAARLAIMHAYNYVDHVNGHRPDAYLHHAMEALDRARAALFEEPSRWVLLEVKDISAATPGGKQCIKASELAPGGKYEDVLDHCRPEVARKLRRDQADFLLRHRAPRYVVTSVEEALRACGLEPTTGDTE